MQISKPKKTKTTYSQILQPYRYAKSRKEYCCAPLSQSDYNVGYSLYRVFLVDKLDLFVVSIDLTRSWTCFSRSFIATGVTTWELVFWFKFLKTSKRLLVSGLSSSRDNSIDYLFWCVGFIHALLLLTRSMLLAESSILLSLAFFSI
jgi:hypothetical protein